MADYGPFQVGAIALPLSTSSSNTLLRDSDPAIYFALDYWSWLIAQYVGARLQQAAVVAGPAPVAAAAVAQRYPWDPFPALAQENQLKFPLLACYRKESKYERKEISWERDRTKFDLVYVLPPLTGGQVEQLVPVFRAVEATLRKKTTQGFDPAYTPPGGTVGQEPWTLALAGVEEIGFDRGQYGIAPGMGNLAFPFLLMSGEIIERDNYVPATNKFAGGDITAAIVAPDGTTVPGFTVQQSTQQAPTVASLSTTTGPVAGGTSVSITGTLFLSGPPVVLFGNQLATNVVWNSAASLSCKTPAMSGAGTVGVTVVNRDGQAGSLPAAFTFT